MSREDPQMKLRLPEALRDRIRDAAEVNGRSMNAEIVSRLEASFEAAATPPDQNVFERYATEIARIAAQEAVDGMVQTFRRPSGPDLVIARKNPETGEDELIAIEIKSSRRNINSATSQLKHYLSMNPKFTAGAVVVIDNPDELAGAHRSHAKIADQ